MEAELENVGVDLAAGVDVAAGRDGLQDGREGEAVGGDVAEEHVGVEEEGFCGGG